MSNPYLRLAAPGVASLKPYLPGKPISELEREYGVTNIVKLASNENPLGPGKRALDAIQACTDSSLSRYPDGGGFDLKQALGRRHGLDPACITLGNGSNDVLVMIAEAFLQASLEAIHSQYAFAVYPIAIQAVGATGRAAPALAPGSEGAYGHDLTAMADLINDKTRLVFIANPNNPTGTWLRAEPLRNFLEQVPQETLVVVDQAYAEYMDDPDYPDCVDWLDRFPNLIVTHTFSKAFGLAGLRVGYSVSAPGIAQILERVRQPFNVNVVANAAALAALEDHQHLARSVELNAGERERLQHGFANLGLEYVPSAGNFVLVEMGQDAAAIYDALLRSSVIVRPVANYGLDQHLRISIGTTSENDRLLDALSQVLGPGDNDESDGG
ncbi:MAG: histidinol-phosphate transaminase [Gammaproteobacteria bacterium]